MKDLDQENEIEEARKRRVRKRAMEKREVENTEDPGNADAEDSNAEFEDDESIDFIDYNSKKDYNTEHANFRRYVKKSRKSIPVLRISLVIAVIAFCASLLFIAYIYKSEKSDNTAFFGTVEKEPEHVFLTNDLQSVASAFNNDTFTAAVASVNGFEYLRLDTKLNGEDVSIFYQNEFPGGTDGGNMLKNYIEKNGQTLAVNTEYDFSNIYASLPRIVELTGSGNGFLWVSQTSKGVPSSMTLFDVVNMEKAGGINVNGSLGYYFPVEDGGEADFLLNVTNSGMTYTYKTDSELYNKGRSGQAIDFLDAMDFTLDTQKFSFTTVVKLGEGYIGEYAAEMSFSKNGFIMGEQSYHPYLRAEYYEKDSDKILTPSDHIWENPVLIDGILLERYKNVETRTIASEMIIDPEQGNRYIVDENGKMISSFGIDVSAYQGDIDWEKVAASGVKFAIIRVASRGYSKGALNVDEKFEDNIKGALKAGLKVGVYVFSQAVNTEEAKEEAEIAIKNLKGYDITGPIVIDTELISESDTARANDLSIELRTEIVKTFCDTVKAAGYKPMVYAGTYWLQYNLNWDEFADVPVWYAYYGHDPLMDYKFAIWQYTYEGKIDGIEVNTVDLNLMLDDMFE